MDRDRRFKYLRLTLARRHRYRWYRTATLGMTLALLFAVPLLGVARIDLWGGRHVVLGRAVPLVPALVGISLAISVFYVVTFAVNLPAGRMFCGFGCPVGQLSRLADTIDAFEKDPAHRRRGWLELWGWGFCRTLCPIGLYYSVVHADSLVGIDFDPAATCTRCGGCNAICPVELDPRHLDAVVPSPGGLALAGFPGTNHCLHCGACIEICEHLTRKVGGPAAMGFRRPGRRRRSFSEPT